jgi:phosphoesterase RecJ-like protein
MIVMDEFHAALIYLTKSDLKRFHYKVGDTEGIVNYPLSMDKINLSILLTEKDKMIKMSFRSKGDFSVNELVRKHFNGGGHKNAAGGKSFTTVEKAIEEIKKVLPLYKDQLNYVLSYDS